MPQPHQIDDSYIFICSVQGQVGRGRVFFGRRTHPLAGCLRYNLTIKKSQWALSSMCSFGLKIGPVPLHFAHSQDSTLPPNTQSKQVAFPPSACSLHPTCLFIRVLIIRVLRVHQFVKNTARTDVTFVCASAFAQQGAIRTAE